MNGTTIIAHNFTSLIKAYSMVVEWIHDMEEHVIHYI